MTKALAFKRKHLDPKASPGLLETLAMAAATAKVTKNNETTVVPIVMLELLFVRHSKGLITGFKTRTGSKKGNTETTLMSFTQFILSQGDVWSRNEYEIEIPTKHAARWIALGGELNV